MLISAVRTLSRSEYSRYFALNIDSGISGAFTLVSIRFDNAISFSLHCYDFLSGLILAIVFKKSSKIKNGRVSSEAGIKGLAKKIFILFLVALAEQLDIVLGTNLVRDGAVIAFISMEGVSILENSTLAGLPVPRMIKNALEVLSKGEDKKDE